MSLFDFLTKSPSLAARITATINFSIFGSKTRQTNVVIPINNISIATQPGIKWGLPDIIAGTGGNDFLQGNSGGSDVPVTIGPFSVTYKIPTVFSDADRTDNIPAFSIPLPDTGKDLLFGFGGNDTLNGGDDS
jgi:hypothetical protein